MQFSYAAVAGTFDRLHKGHEALLRRAFAVAGHVAVGITTDELTSGKKLYALILPYETRVQGVKDFLHEHNLLGRAEFFALHDVFGPAISDKRLEALVVSSKTMAGGKRVNKKRTRNKLPPLALVVCDYVSSEDNSYLSSTRLRFGEITREGHVYEKFLKQHAPFTPSTQVREILKLPLGTLLKGPEGNESQAIKTIQKPCGTPLITIGDVVTKSFLNQGIMPDIVVVDYRTNRSATEKISTPGVVVHAANTPGTISKEAVGAVSNILKQYRKQRQNFVLHVTGEEDLLVLPFMLLAPLETIIVYGQPKEGVVKVVVSEENKNMVERLLQRAAKS